MRNIITYIFFLAMMVLASCNRSVSPSEYVKYVENPNNGLKIKQEINGVGYTLQYQPIDYCVMQEERSFSIPSETFKAEYDRFKGLEHYTFRIEKGAMDSLVNKLGDTSKYKKGITEYFDFWIQKDIKLVEGIDTIPCSICQADANTGMASSYAFTLGFSNKNTQEESQADRVLIFENKFLHTDKVMLCVKGKDIKNIPVLKLM